MAHKTAATWHLDGSSINPFVVCVGGTGHLVLNPEFLFPTYLRRVPGKSAKCLPPACRGI